MVFALKTGSPHIKLFLSTLNDDIALKVGRAGVGRGVRPKARKVPRAVNLMDNCCCVVQIFAVNC